MTKYAFIVMCESDREDAEEFVKSIQRDVIDNLHRIDDDVDAGLKDWNISAVREVDFGFDTREASLKILNKTEVKNLIKEAFAESGGSKMQTIKIFRQLYEDRRGESLGLKESRDFVESVWELLQ